MTIEKKGKFWIGTSDGKIVYRSHIRPNVPTMAVEQHPQESFDEKYPDNTSIKEILTSLNPAVDEHWTKRGLPSMPYIEKQLGDTSITRKDVSKAMPGLKRK